MAELVPPQHRSFIVKKIRSLLPNAEIYAFGSRIRGDAKVYSDLDIAIACGEQAVSLSVLSQLSESFAQSSIPFKIDIVDIAAVDSDFQAKIRKTSVRW